MSLSGLSQPRDFGYKPDRQLPSMSKRSEVSTHRQWARHRQPQPTDQCQDPRQRWPSFDAGIQLFFRVACIALNLEGLIQVLLTRKDAVRWPVFTSVSIYYGILFNAVEIACLTAPPIFNFRQFPRLPSIWLAAFDLGAIVMIIWSMQILLMPNVWRRDPNSKDLYNLSSPGNMLYMMECPPAICVTAAENRAVTVFGQEVLTGCFHIGFVVMSLTHFLKRKVPEWLDMASWNSNWDFDA